MAVDKMPPKPKAVSKKTTAKAVKKIDKPRKDRRGCPPGKGVVVPTRKRNGTGGRIGNPKHVATAELKRLVETHAACGTPHWLIAIELQISETTLYQYYRFELDTGLLRLNARMGSLVAKQGLAGCRSSQSLWLKSRGGWAEKTTMVLTGPNGRPVELAAAPRNPDLKKLSDREVKDYLRIQAKLEGVADGDS